MKTVKLSCQWCNGKRRWWQSPCMFCDGRGYHTYDVPEHPTCRTCRLGVSAPSDIAECIECHYSRRSQTFMGGDDFCEQHQDWKYYVAWHKWLDARRDLIIQESK